jgi:hypothetical protein
MYYCEITHDMYTYVHMQIYFTFHSNMWIITVLQTTAWGIALSICFYVSGMWLLGGGHHLTGLIIFNIGRTLCVYVCIGMG